MQSLLRITSILCKRPRPIDNIRYLKRSPFFWNVSNSNNVSSFNLCELTELIMKNKRISIKLMTDILSTIDYGKITVEEGSFLLQCCGEFTVDTNVKERDKICKKIYKGLLDFNKLNINIYQTYIKVCTDNRVAIQTKELLNCMKCKPDQKLYKYLLENVCQNGNIEEAYSLLELMKHEGLFADEDIFNSLALAHAAKIGLESAETILLTMKTAQVPITNNTKASVLQGIIKSGNPEDLNIFLEKYAFQLDENQLLIILKELGLGENISWLPKIEILHNTLTLSREFPNQLRNICIHLVHMDKSVNAMKLIENSGNEISGYFILEEMLHCRRGIDEIISLAKFIQTREQNEYVLKNLTELALQHQNTDAAWKLFENLGELKPHYFWSLLLSSHQKTGEFGVIEVIKNMLDMNVKPDDETLEHYVLPFCNLKDPHLLVEKINKLGLTIKDVLSPVLKVLLRNGETRLAAALCDSYNVSISGQNLLESLLLSWQSSKDGKSVATILQRFCESFRGENDIVGDFLIRSLKNCESIKDFESFGNFVKHINEKKLKMTTSSSEVLCNILDEKCEENLSQQIRKDLNMLLDFRLKPEAQFIPHPRDMSVEELECHLIELEEKNMETRGVLRRLIQQHAMTGNSNRVKQLLDRFLAAGYTATTGMKSMVMYSFVKAGRVQPALDIHNELKESDPNFSVDVFKILDLATLLVKTGESSQALEILQERSRSKIFGGLAIQRNCVELLKAYENDREQMVMFEYLIEKGFCKATNVILGPLVRIHLKNGDLEKAVFVYTSLVEKYRCTPLQLEIMKEIVRSNNENLLQRVLDCSTQIHGKTSTQSVLIIALAEEGRDKILGKILSTNKLPVKNDLKKRCERLAKERKVEALSTLARCCERLSNEVIDIAHLYECVMRVHSSNNDCQSALKLYNFLVDNELLVSRNLENQLCDLLRHNNCDLPGKLKINNNK